MQIFPKKSRTRLHICEILCIFARFLEYYVANNIKYYHEHEQLLCNYGRWYRQSFLAI